MFWETVGFLLTSFVGGVIVLFWWTSDIFPYVLKKALNKLALSNWQKKLPQKLPIYNPLTPTNIKDAGVIPQDMEYEIEKPQQILQPGDVDDLLLYGVDNNGNALVAKISRLWNGLTEVTVCLHVNGEIYRVNYQGETTNSHDFSLGNFKLEMVEPFRTWRLWYNGTMENQRKIAEEENLVHVTINFLWKALENPGDSQKNANLDLLSEHVSGNGVFGHGLTNIKEILPNGYFQFGSFNGFVKVDDNNTQNDPLYLYGYRLRRYLHPISEQNYSEDDDRRMELFGMCGTNGNAFRLISFKDDWIDGEISYSSFDVRQILQLDIEAKSCRRNHSMPKRFTMTDSKFSQMIEIWPKFDTIQISNSLEIVLFKLDMNGKPGRGILIRKLDSFLQNSKSLLQNCKSLVKCTERMPKNIASCKQFFVDLCSTECIQVAFVGGKAASLAKLVSLRTEDFKTARGFCATTHLFRCVVNLQEISEIFKNRDQSDLDDLCLKAISIVKSSGAEEKISPLVDSWMETVFGKNRTIDMRFAVRSSGTLEDGAELSCAGQNDTFLGVGADSIAAKIVDCWASLFTPQSVKYRLNHGQPAVSEMGVVIQELVNAASAGVLFTANPRTGNTFEMLITSNYGLGESVVSASCDPDSVIVLRSRSTVLTDSQTLRIGKKSLGDKKSKVVVASDGKFTKEISVSDEDAKKFCINDEIILKLGIIGIKIQKEMGQLKPVDIEWAISEKGEVYILQSRAMTSLDAWTDYEIIHQFDSAIRSPIERFTTANTGEVLPKPIHSISFQSMVKTIDIGVQRRQYTAYGGVWCPVMERSCPVYGHRVILNMLNSLYKNIDATLTPALACVDLTLFGRQVINEELHQIALERFGANSGKQKLNSIIHAIKLVRGCTKQITQAEKKYRDWTFNFHGLSQTSIAFYNQITDDLFLLHDIMENHCAMSEASSITLIFTFMALTEGKEVKDWPPTIYEDAGVLLSAYSAVESAELPVDIEELGVTIVKHGLNHQEFLLKNSHEAIEWLRKNDLLGAALDKFYKKHGHRSISELDIGMPSWKTDPTTLVAMLKNIVRNKLILKEVVPPSVKVTYNSENELLDSLATPLKTNTKRFIKFLLPYCRKTVIYREKTKSLTVRTGDQLKQAYDRLGQLMVQECLLPNINLLKHLSHTEIGLLIKKDPSSSTIIYKAMRRLRLYPSLESIDYPEICIGVPQPIDNSVPIEITDVIHATPVSSGKVQGIAKVCLSVEEASESIQQGDILITKGTDIAWSPFFPLLGGVVTELGGLISHGAVVAREYGLPCIVGAINATKIFKTGDEVVLDTSTGTLAKVKKISETNGHSIH